MEVYFFDSSALVKGYVNEIGSQWIRMILEAEETATLFIARITSIEVVAAFARKGKSGELSPDDVAWAVGAFRESLPRAFEILEITPRLANRAMDIAETYRLRGYDAVQLSAAIGARNLQEAANEDVPIFISADGDLNTAAIAEGFRVENPNTYR